MEAAKLKLDESDLGGAIAAAIESVKKKPTDVATRTFLFELSCFSGDWDRADKQLDAIGHQDTKAGIGTLIYRQNLQSEKTRVNLFEHSTRPEFLGAIPSYVEDLLQAIDLVRRGEISSARELLDKVEDDRPACPVTLNDEDFDDFRDYNDLTMCVFEAFVKDSYIWLPMEQVVSIEFLERKSLRDIYWPQAKVELTNGTAGEMFLPSLYVNTWKNADDQIRLGRSVDWRDLGDEVYVGEGSRLFWAGGKDVPLLDVKTVFFKRDE